MTKTLSESTLVGRELELTQLVENLNSTFKGNGATVFVSGDAGSGKTRLTNEFLKIAKKKGATVLSGWCISDAAAPYFPFVEAFSNYFSPRQKKSEKNANLTDEIMSNPGSDGMEELGITAFLTGMTTAEKSSMQPRMLSPQVWKDQLFAAVSKTLDSIIARSPTVLFLEDIHWADSASLALLHYISRVMHSSKLLILATFRSEELTSDLEGHQRPLTETLRAMRREDLFREIQLHNLHQDSVSKIAENMIGGAVHPSFAKKLADVSQGNPLFIVESLRMLTESKGIVSENNQWQLAVDELRIPSKVRDIILRRLAMLTYTQRRVLDAASVVGEKFDVDLLSMVLGQDSLDVMETLNIIAKSTSLVQIEESTYRFDHAKSRDAIYSEIPLPLRKGYHNKVAQKLEQVKRSGDIPFSEIAHHYVQAGEKVKAVKNALAAGQQSLARFSNNEAIEQFTFVLKSEVDISDIPEIRRITLEGLGDAYYASCLFDNAIETYEQIVASETGIIRLRALRKAMDAIFYKQRTGDYTKFVKLVRKAEELAASDRLENARVLVHKGRMRILADRSLKAHQLGYNDTAEALQIFEEEYSLADAAVALVGIAAESTKLHSKTQAISAIQRSITILEELGDLGKLIDAVLYAGIIFSAYGLFQEALSKNTQVLEIGKKIGDFTRMAEACLRIGRILTLQGKPHEAEPNILRAYEYSQKTDASWIQIQVLNELVTQYSETGDLDHAKEYYKKLSQYSPQVLQNSPVTLNSQITHALANATFFTAQDMRKEAKQYFNKALELADNAESVIHTIRVKTHCWWMLRKQGQTEAAEKLLQEVREVYEAIDKEFSNFNVDAHIMIPRKIRSDEEFEMRLDIVNISRSNGFLIRTENLLPSEFEATIVPSNCILRNGCLEMNNKAISAFEVVTVKLKFEAKKAGSFSSTPKIVCNDNSGTPKTIWLEPINVTVEPSKPKYEILPGRIPTGFDELDELLLGGVPEGYTVVLTSPPTDEREQIIKRFLEAGIEVEETTFYITTEPEETKALAEKYPSTFHIVVCNLQDEAMMKTLPNISKVKSVENLSEIDIALTKALRTASPVNMGPKRICIEIISDVLLQHHALTTRKWLAALLTSLKSKGFTVLGIVDQSMHKAEEVRAILGLFNGEINLTEKDTPQGAVPTLRVVRLNRQKYLENELTIDRSKLQQ